MKHLAKLFVAGGFFFLQATAAGQPWVHIGDFKTQSLCEHAFVFTIEADGPNSPAMFEMQSSTNPDEVVDPKDTPDFGCFHEN